MSSQVVRDQAVTFVELQALAVPEHIITGLNELSDLIVSDCVAIETVSDVESLKQSDAANKAESTQTAIVERICEGVLNTEELRVLQDVASEVVLLRSKPSAQVQRPKKGENQLTDQLVNRYVARKEQQSGISTRWQRKVVNPAAQQFFDICEAVAEKGMYLLDEQTLRQVDDQNIDSPDKFADLLVAMSLIDLVTFANTVPENWVDQMTGLGMVNVSSNRQRLTIALIDGVYDHEQYRKVLKRLFNAAPRRRFDKTKLKPEFADLPPKAIALRDIARVADEYHRIHPTPEQTIDTSTYTPKTTAKQVRTARQSAADQKRAQILADTNEYFAADPSANTMLGSLGVEACIQTIYAAGHETGIKPPQGLRALHEAVGTQAETEFREQAIRDNSRIVRSFAQTHHVTASAIRSLDHNLELRRGLESVCQPGSGEPIFSRDGAQQVAGIALRLVNRRSEDHERFWADFDECASAAAVLRQLHRPIGEAQERTLFGAIEALTGLGDAAYSRVLGDELFRPVRLLIKQHQAYLDSQVTQAP